MNPEANAFRPHKNQLSMGEPARLAWLLRDDLKKALPEVERDATRLMEWWSQYGLSEYPVWLTHSILKTLPHNRRFKLLRPLTRYPSLRLFGVSPLLLAIWERRTDLQRRFDLDSQSGIWGAIAWMFSIGIIEFEVNRVCGVDKRISSQLDESYPFELVGVSETKASGHVQVTWLMFFLWRTEAHLQKKFDLKTASDRIDYIAWFLIEGVARYQLQPWLGTNTQSLLKRYLAKSSSSVTRAKSKPERDNHGINIIGYALGELGIGEDARMAAMACESAGIPYKVINIAPGAGVRQADTTLLERLTAQDSHEPHYRINLFCLTGFETARVYLERGHSLFAGKKNIGWWPWELPVWPKQWDCVFSMMDEIWAATRFTEGMYLDAVKRSASNVPVIYMPMAVSVDHIRFDKNVTAVRRHLGLKKTAFLFLYIFDFNSYIDRKNPEAVLDAFEAAFPPQKSRALNNAGLVFKVMNTKTADARWRSFLKRCNKDARILLIDKTLNRSELLSLMNACDAYVSLHRSEGFGRTLAEAMLLNKPVIATDFSGNRDFVTKQTAYPVAWRKKRVCQDQYPFVQLSDKAWWAEPDITDAAKAMREVFGLEKHCGKRAAFAEFRLRYLPSSVGLTMNKTVAAFDFFDLYAEKARNRNAQNP